MAYAPFVPLRIFSSYTMLDGAIEPKAIAKLARGNAAVGVVPEGTHVVSAPERLEALAKYKPEAPAP